MILVHVFRVKLNYKFRGGLLGLTFAMGAQITSGQPPPLHQEDKGYLSSLFLGATWYVHGLISIMLPVSVTICSG